MATQVQEALAILRRKEVEARTGLSRSGIYAAIAAGRFPRPIQIDSTRSVGWSSAEISKWIEAQIAANRKVA